MFNIKFAVINEKIIGKTLAITIYDKNSVVLAKKGSLVTQKMIGRFKKLGIISTYVEDDGFDIVIEELIDSNIKVKLLKALQKEFEDIKNTEYINDEVIKDIAKEIIENINPSENAIFVNNFEISSGIPLLALHCLDVAILSVLVGLKSDYNYEDIKNLAVNALLHDVGKLFFEDERHVEKGYKLAKGNYSFSPKSTIAILQHHEWVNGGGYPKKLKTDDIYKYSKIIALCNEYVNLMSKKVFPNEVIEALMVQVNIKFDNEVFKNFMNAIYCYPNGLEVKLNNGIRGTVIEQNKNFPTRPVIAFKKENTANYINLVKDLTLFVKEVLV